MVKNKDAHYKKNKGIIKNRLKEMRLSKNLTLKQVGEGVGLATNTISRYEISNREPSLEVWKKLADFFGVTVPYFISCEFSWASSWRSFTLRPLI